MLYPIYNLLLGRQERWNPSLELNEDEISISYKVYKTADEDDMQTIIDDKLTPGLLTRKLTLFLHFLISFRNFAFLVSAVEFKIRRSKIIKFLVASVLHGHQGQVEVAHAMVLDIYDKDNDMLIFKNTYDDPENGQTKQIKVRRTSPNAPEELYFVHIEVKDVDNLPGQKERTAIKKSEQ